MMKFILIIWFICSITSHIYAQIPDGYYTESDGKTGYQLKTALYNTIKEHQQQTYSSLWEHFKTTDAKADGKVWDMYSDVPDGSPAYTYTFTTDQCGNYSVEGDCYNREHSWPKSWFNDGYPMYTDLFHLYPTDGKVNGERGNYPFGEVKTAEYTSTNKSKRGPCNDPSYAGTVFEPIDAYKGDFARSYFYMATRYENVIANWEKFETNGDVVLNGTSQQVFEEWYLNLLFKWHTNDPVSPKEVERNNAIYLIQGNRNPFIDHPEYIAKIWFNPTSNKNMLFNVLVDVFYSKNDASIHISSNPESISRLMKIDVYSLSGRLEISQVVIQEKESIKLNTNSLPQGIYIISLGFDNQEKLIKKVAIY